MKKNFILIPLFAVVAAQLGWLGYNYYARTVEIETAPTLTVECDALDPRDIFRGDYVRFFCSFSYPITDPIFADLLHWNKELRPKAENVWVRGSSLANDPSQLVITMQSREVPNHLVQGIPPRAATNKDSLAVTYDNYKINDLVGFWQLGEPGKPATLLRVAKAGSGQDVARPGEFRTAMYGHVRCKVVGEPEEKYVVKSELSLYLCVSERNDLGSFRFYVPENTGEPLPAWREGQQRLNLDEPFPANRIRTTVDFACREKNGFIVKQLYINGIPWVEAIEKMRMGTFPLSEESK